jgi:hypothetical protein
MGRRAQPEAALQRALLQHIEARGTGWLVWATPNAARRSPRLGAELKRQGLTPGVGDLSLLEPPQARYHELELKSAKGRLSPAQRDRRDAVRAAGGTWEVAFGLDDALELLLQWGAIR